VAPIRVLLIDDEEPQFIFLQHMLEGVAPGAYDVRWASNYADGLRRLAEGAVDVALVDYRLGASSGIDLIGEAAQKVRGEIPLIMLTGHGDRRLDLEAMESGAAEYLSKADLTPELLDRTLRYAVRQAHSYRMMRRSEERFRALIQNTWDAILVLDPQFHITFASESTRTVTGLTVDALTGLDACDLIHPDDADAARARLQRCLATPGCRVSGECRSRHTDGSWRHCELIAVNRLDDPAVNGIVVNYRDVTERLRSESEYRSLFDASPIGMAHVNLEGRFVRVNRRLCKMLGFQESDLEGRLSTSLMHADDVPAAGDARQALLDGTLPRFESERRYRRRDGTFLWVRTHAELHRDARGEPHYFILAIQDISARKAAEEQLRRTVNQLQAVVSAVPMSLWALDRDGIVTFSEGRLLERFGAQPGELIGRSQLEMYRDQPEVLELTRRALSGETVHMNVTLGNGVFETWYMPLRDDAHQLVGTIGVALEITDRLRLEEQFRQAQKMEAVGHLAGGVAHDFNNLLTAIIGYGELAISALPADSDVRSDVEEILKAGQSAAALTRQLLAFSRQQVLLPQVVNINDVVGRIQSLLRRVIGEDITLATDLAPDVHPVYADPNQLEQIIMNLSVNARDAMPRGGRLTIQTRNVEADSGHGPENHEGRSGPSVFLAVSDTGVGMSADVQRRLFDPFFTTKERGKGTGLGLATVYGIVSQSGGTIDVQSELGRGTSFRILLPISSTAGPMAAVEGERAAADFMGTETILLVEDQAEVRTVARSILQRHGYAVLEAEGPDEAISLSRSSSRRLDLLLTDIVMPVMSGRTLATRLRTERPDLKVLYTSGYTEDRVVHNGVADSGLPFVQKPFTPRALLGKVREVLDS
jgi:two-component system cell cycle sensor histidine kinase/response regulator CckA